MKRIMKDIDEMKMEALHSLDQMSDFKHNEKAHIYLSLLNSKPILI